MTTVTRKTMTRIGLEDSAILTIEADPKDATMEVEVLRFCQEYGSSRPDERVRCKLTRAEAELVRGSLDAWLEVKP